MSDPIQILPLHLAEADEVVKILIGVVFAVIWIAAQAVAAAGARKKRRERQTAQGLALPRQPNAAPEPSEHAQLERHLRQQREETRRRMQQPDRQQQRARTQESRAIRELRQVMGGVERAKAAPQKRKPKQAVPAAAAEWPRRGIPADSTMPLGAGTGIRAGEIGSDSEEQAVMEAARRRSIHGVRSLLTPRNARNVILAGEVLGPPVALREEASR